MKYNWLKTHRRTFACLLLLVVVSSLSQTASAAAATSPWLTPEPTIKKLSRVDPEAPLTPSMISNLDCQPAEIVTRPARFLPPQTKQSHDSCIVDTGFGALSASGYLQRPGSDAFGYLNASVGNQGVAGIPRTNNALATIASAPHGAYVGFYDNLRNIVSTSSINDTVTHTLPPNPSAVLKDQAGNLLSLELSSLSFSSEGDWAVVEAPGKAMLRINTVSHQVLPFADSVVVENSGAAYRTAVNADGRYAVVISKNRGLLKLYDLSTCATIPDTISGPVACTSVDLLPFISSKIKNYSSVASVRFRGDYALELYINTSSGMEHVLVTAAGQDAVHFEYLALGDSFASGEGAFQYKSLTDTTTNGCHLSLRSYPYLIAHQLHLNQTESVACSGATMDDFTNNQADYRQNRSQASGKEDKSFDEAILSGFLPGYRAQKLFIKRYTPQVVTLSIGGNDIGFSDILVRCLGPDTCYDHYEDRLELMNEISAQFDKLSGLYTEIKQSSPESERIYAVGYPEIVDPTGNCALNVHLDRDELLLANALVSHLNEVIKAAAEHAGVSYLDTQDALHGNRLCETSSARVAVNGLTIGNDILNFPFIHGPLAKESFHPNSLGHELLRNKILLLTNNFSVLNNAPKSTTKTKDPNTSSPALKKPKANRPLRKTIHKKSSGPATAKKKTKRTATTKTVGSTFKLGSSPKVVLDGGEAGVGTVVIGPDDSITTEVIVPDDTPEGPHTIDVIGENTSGEPVDVTETIIVDDDLSDPCGVFKASGIDSDKDGIDDACDGIIGNSEITPSNNPMGSSTSDGQTTINTGQSQIDPVVSPPNSNPTNSEVNLQPIQNPQDSTLTNSTPLQVTVQIPTNLDYQTPNLAVLPLPKLQSRLVAEDLAIQQVKAAQNTKALTNSHSLNSQNPYAPASYYNSPKRLDFVHPRNLLFILLVLILVIAFLIYKRKVRNEHNQR